MAYRRRRCERLAGSARLPSGGLTTLPALEGRGPVLTMARDQLRAWFDLWGRCPELRAQIRKAWPKIYFRLRLTEARKRWKQRRGPIGSLLLLLWSFGWDARAPDKWSSEDGTVWMMGEGGDDGDPTEIIDAVLADARRQLRAQASKRRDGNGLQHDVDATDSCTTWSGSGSGVGAPLTARC